MPHYEGYESFELHMGFSFPFLCANDLRTSLLIMITRSFFTLIYVGGTYATLLYICYKNSLHMIAVLIVFYAKTGKRNLMKKYQNKTATRQIQDSVTVINLKASKINTPLSLSTYQAWCWSAATSIFVFDSLDALSILRRHIRCCCCILRARLPPPTPPLLS